ncbi:hypothetical protein CsSME_00008024 [Camellia sinensis var. sinensis]
MATNTAKQDVIRRSAGYHPSIWGITSSITILTTLNQIRRKKGE